VTKKLWAPVLVTFVVIIQNRPSWCPRVGAKTPRDDHPPVSVRSSWDGRSSTWPMSFQWTRF